MNGDGARRALNAMATMLGQVQASTPFQSRLFRPGGSMSSLRAHHARTRRWGSGVYPWDRDSAHSMMNSFVPAIYGMMQMEAMCIYLACEEEEEEEEEEERRRARKRRRVAGRDVVAGDKVDEADGGVEVTSARRKVNGEEVEDEEDDEDTEDEDDGEENDEDEEEEEEEDNQDEVDEDVDSDEGDGEEEEVEEEEQEEDEDKVEEEDDEEEEQEEEEDDDDDDDDDDDADEDEDEDDDDDEEGGEVDNSEVELSSIPPQGGGGTGTRVK